MPLSQIVNQVITIARAGGLQGNPPPLEGFLKRQTAYTLNMLALVMLVGRGVQDGSYDLEDASAQYDEMRDTFDNLLLTIDKLLEKMQLADYLEDGLQAFKDAGVNVDNPFPSKPPRNTP